MPGAQNLEPLLSAQQNQLELTFSASDTLDNKALALLALNAGLVIYSLQSELSNPLWLVIPLFTCFVLSMLCNFIGFWPSKYEYIGPGVNLDEHQEYLRLGAHKLILQLLADVGLAIGINAVYNEQKWLWLARSTGLMAAGILVLIGCILYS